MVFHCFFLDSLMSMEMNILGKPNAIPTGILRLFHFREQLLVSYGLAIKEVPRFPIIAYVC